MGKGIERCMGVMGEVGNWEYSTYRGQPRIGLRVAIRLRSVCLRLVPLLVLPMRGAPECGQRPRWFRQLHGRQDAFDGSSPFARRTTPAFQPLAHRALTFGGYGVMDNPP